MDDVFQAAPIVCPNCQGDPRASAQCATCHGAQVALPSPDGQLVWAEPIDDFAFAFRHLRARVTVFFHLVLVALLIICVSSFIVGALRQDDLTRLVTPEFWQEGRWFVTTLWFAGLLACFLIFRLRVYGHPVKVLPNWGKSKRELEKMATDAAKHAERRFEVSAYFLPAAWTILQDAYALAQKTGTTEVTPVHLYAAALTSAAGGIFLTRLGLPYEKLKPGLIALLREGQSGSPTRFSVKAKTVLLEAYLDARASGRKSVGTIELFLQAFLADEGLQDMMDAVGFPPTHVAHVAEWIRIQEQLREEHDRFRALAALKPKTSMNRTMTARQTQLLDRFSEDLTLLAREGYIGPVVGRDKEMGELLRAFESGKRAVCLVGEAGTGKTALVEALARRMVEEDVPPELFDQRLVSVHLAELVAGGDPGASAERLIQMLHEAGSSGNILLVLEGIEALSGGGIGGPMDLAEAFASELDRGYLRVLATTTPQAWTSFIERRSLGAKMAQVRVAEMEPSDAIRVLMARAGGIEYQNHVFFSYASVERAVNLAGRYLQDRQLPESAIDVAREAAVFARKERGEQTFVSAEDVAKIIHDRTNIPVSAVSEDESEKLLKLEERLHGRVIGQDAAVVAVSQAMRRARAEMRSGNRPIANFLFLGPTGVGKTELSKALAAEYFGSEEAMIRLDMSEYQDQGSIARVIGAPGDARGGLLTEAVRRQPFAIVLLDELEKAHPDILTLFLQVMDDGRLTDGIGRTIDFTNVVLIATSNAGTSFIQEQVSQGASLESIKTHLLERELKGIFRPEFLNRFDGVIVFKPLSLEDVTQIARLLLKGVAKRLEEKGIGFRAEEAAVQELARAGYDPLFGARPLRRVIQERIDNALADLILRKEVNRKDTVILGESGALQVEKTMRFQ
jgi:ATP-dependent Clp protease ATP-binding subunit ClpC